MKRLFLIIALFCTENFCADDGRTTKMKGKPLPAKYLHKIGRTAPICFLCGKHHIGHSGVGRNEGVKPSLSNRVLQALAKASGFVRK